MRPICFLRTYSNTTAAVVAGHTTNSRRTRSARFLRNRLGVFPSPSRRTRFSRKHVVVKSVSACTTGPGNLTVFIEMYTPGLMKRRQRCGAATLSVSRSVSPVSYRSCSSIGDHRPESADCNHSSRGLFEQLRLHNGRHNLQVPGLRVRYYCGGVDLIHRPSFNRVFLLGAKSPGMR